MNVTSWLYPYATSLVRQLLTILGATLSAHGLLANSQTEQMLGLAPVLASIIWGLIAHSNIQAAIDTALSMPQGATRRALDERINPDRSN